MAEFTLDLKTVDGRTLDEFARAIERRTELMNKTTKDSVIALSILAMKNLRKNTRLAKKGIRPPGDKIDGPLSIKLVPIYSAFVGFTGKDHKVCLRIGSKSGAISPIKPLWRIPPKTPNYPNAKVFALTLSPGRLEAWPHQKPLRYIVAEDYDSALKTVKNWFGGIRERYQSLGKSAWGRAMALASDKPFTSKVSRQHQAKLDQLVDVRLVTEEEKFGSGAFAMSVRDRLRYAQDALDGGAGAVQVALDAAIKNVNGYLDKLYGPAEQIFSAQGEAQLRAAIPQSALTPTSEDLT